MLYYMNMTHSITITKPTVGSVVKVVTDHSDYFRTAMPYVAAANRFCTTSGKVVPDLPWINYDHFCIKTGNVNHPIAVIPLKNIVNIDYITGSGTEFIETKDEMWNVLSSKNKIQYQVLRKNGRWSCTCVGFKFHNRCKHVTKIQNEVAKCVY